MKKAILIVLAFVILGIVFFFSEERHEEGQTEVSYWKINPEEIRYLPPKNSPEFSKFFSTELVFKKIETGLKTPPHFTIEGNDPESKQHYLYEGSYNVKNLFTEMSVLTTKSINPAKPDVLEKFQISPETSPAIEIVKSSKVEKKIYLGEETRDKSYRYLLADKDLITTGSHIFQKFFNSQFELRERYYTRFGEFELARLQIQAEGIRLTIENNPETKNGMQVSKWFKVQNGKFRMDPTNGANLFAYLQAFKVEVYPDEPDGEGFAVAKELTATETFAQLDIFLVNGLHLKIKLFPKTVLKNKSYYPVLKEVEKFSLQSPSYTSEQSVVQLLDLLKKIQSAPEWTEPKGK
jgi:hypothetical protein